MRLLADLFPDCEHVRNAGLKEAPDSAVWSYAVANSYAIVSKDSDFHQRSLLMGFPPKIVWVHLGDCSTRAVEQVLREHAEDLRAFDADPTATFLILS